MGIVLSSKQVWGVLENNLFAVLGLVTANGEARTVGIVYVVHERKLYIATSKNTWKARHIRGNPHVSLTVTIPKRIMFMPWIKIPAATITFSGIGTVLNPKDVVKDVLSSLLRGLETDTETIASMSVIEVQPVGDFITYGVGIPMMAMRNPEKASGRAPVA
ncbi:MAG: pyridoxamine 5'-phosphate oxidase family protein [Chloroflexi bacterium]|nr:pyridoxamine 5'-phosphate oxidase family protein [Chloroflexota bacterium]